MFEFNIEVIQQQIKSFLDQHPKQLVLNISHFERESLK